MGKREKERLIIYKKEDIFIPFDTMKDVDWEQNTRKIIEAVAQYWENSLKRPISQARISELEKRLGTTLPETQKIFYTTFGLADISENLFRLEKIDWIEKVFEREGTQEDKWWIPDYPTLSEEDKKLLPFLVAFSGGSTSGVNGNLFCFHCETKEIYHFESEKNSLTRFFATFDDYLKGSLIFSQWYLADCSVSEEILKWTDEVAGDLFGKEIVDKWLC